jgi:hypothetical protein
MTTATFNKFNTFVLALTEKKHNLTSDVLQVALCNAAHAPVATNGVLADLTQIAYTNLSSQVITTTSNTQTSGTEKLILVDLVLTASGAVAPFRYVVIFNQSAANDELIGWYDYLSEITMGNTDTFTIDFDGTNGILQLA